MLKEGKKAYRMITRYIITRNDAEDIRWVAKGLLIARIEEGGIPGIKTRGDRCPRSENSGNSTSFDREVG